MAFPGTDLDVIVTVYLGADLTADPSTWTGSDWSDRLVRRPIQIRRGRGKNQQTLQAGSCVFWLENTDGELTPTLATSSYYPDWDLGTPMAVSVDNVGVNPPYRRFAGFVADISAVMVPGVGGDNISAVQVTLAGIVRRLTQGAVAKSALFRTITGQNAVALPVAYWPLESEGALASVLSSWVSPVMDAIVAAGISPGAAPPPAGSAGALEIDFDINDLSALALPVTVHSVTGETVVTLHVRQSLAGAPSGATQLAGVFSIQPTGSMPTLAFQWLGGSGLFANSVQVANATVSLNISTAVDIVSDDGWHEIQLRATQNGADIDFELWVDGVLGGTDTVVGKTFDRVERIFQFSGFSFDSGGGLVSGISPIGLCHISVHTDAGIGQYSDTTMGGYPGEQAHERVERNCAEEGILYLGTAVQSNEMGPQPVADVMAVFRDCEEVDHGILIEARDAFGLDYRASSQRENLEPAITIDLSTYRTTSGTQGEVLTPVRNDARMRNEWKVARPNGAAKTASDAAHVARHGRYNDEATVNVEDDTRIVDEAQWRVHEGTFDGLRYATVPLDIAANQ